MAPGVPIGLDKFGSPDGGKGFRGTLNVGGAFEVWSVRAGLGERGEGRFVGGDGVLRCGGGGGGGGGGEFGIRGGSGNPHIAMTLSLPSASL